MANDPIKVGGPYVENEDHVPDPSHMRSQYNTEGVGAHQRVEEVSPIFEVDKVKTAQEALGALDPKNKAVSSDRVILPNAVDDNETAKKDLTERAKARVKDGVEIGGPTPAQVEAEESGDEGTQKAVEQERGNAAANSAGGRDAGQHETDDEKKATGAQSGSKSSSSKSDSKSGSKSSD